MNWFQKWTIRLLVKQIFRSKWPGDSVEFILEEIDAEAQRTFYDDNRMTRKFWFQERLDAVLAKRVHN